MSAGMNMDELVGKLLTDPKAREEWMEVAKRLEAKYPDKEKKEPEKKKEVFKVSGRTTPTPDQCALTYADGYSICFTSDGGMFLEHESEKDTKASKSLKSISEASPKAFKTFMESHLIDLEDLMFVVSSVGYLFSREAVKAFDRHKEVVAKAEQKTRYVSIDKRRAFMAGLVCGRNT